MADFVDNLTDSELRTKLTEYGFPTLPITGTTRKIMVKKLKLLMENNTKTKQDARHTLSRYSSEEESDTDVKDAKKNRRATVAASAMNPPTSTNRRRSGKFVEPPTVEKSVESKSITRRSTRVVKSMQDEFDTGSDSEPEVVEVKDSESDTSGNNLSHNDNNLSYSRKATTRTTTFSSTSSPGRSSRLPAATSSPYDNQDATSSNHLSQLRSRHSLLPSTSKPSSSSATSSSYFNKRTTIGGYDSIGSPSTSGILNKGPSNAASSATIPGEETPFLSNFTRRLSQLSSPAAVSSPSGSIRSNAAGDYRNDIIKEHDTNGSTVGYGRGYLLRSLRNNRGISYEFQSSQEKNVIKNNLVSFAIIGVVIVFFLAIAVMYLGIRSDHPAIPFESGTIPICLGFESEDPTKRGVSCLTQEEANSALKLLEILKEELNKRAVNYACNDRNMKPHMSDSDIVTFMTQNYAIKDPAKVEEHLRSLQLLVLLNPNWGVSVVPMRDGISPEKTLQTMDEVQSNRKSKMLGLVVFNPSRPIKCIFFNTIYSIFYTIVVTAIVIVLFIMTSRLYELLKRRRKERSDQVYLMVEKIRDFLQTNSENNENYHAVNHVRDMLITSTVERKKMLSIWNEAVKYIEENESRVRTENQKVAGEEFLVWRWIGSSNLNLSGTPKSHTWQGQAFETQVGSVNSLPVSPTNCLKIRGMVNEQESHLNYNAIREAVLAKCANKCRILHCAVDTLYGCVYLKCADQNDAAIAYTNLHGWWYNRHLVTAKYLRLERYMQRFPDSPTVPPYLKSNSPDPDTN